MPIKRPTGYVTRPEASKLFNRSQRQLERDLDVAYLAEDHEVLCRYKLMTKDGELRDAKDVTTQQVKQLQSDGMIPVWYIETSYLEQEYGRKGEPKPAKPRENVAVTLQKVPNEFKSDPAEGRANGEESGKSPLLLSDTEFLRECIQTLERLNQQEKDRHDRIVEKLFEQLDVKDKQISPGGPAGHGWVPKAQDDLPQASNIIFQRRTHPPFPNPDAIESVNRPAFLPLSLGTRVTSYCSRKVSHLVATQPGQNWPGHP